MIFSKQFGTAHAKGYILLNGKLLEGSALFKYFQTANSFSEFQKLLLDANGQFYIVIIKDQEIWIGVDRLRNFPIFYTLSNDEWQVADSIFDLKKPNENTLNDEAAISFLNSGYCLNNTTLCKDIYQVEAGQCIRLKTNMSIEKHFYHQFRYEKPIECSFEAAAKQLQEILMTVFEDYTKVFGQQEWAVSLSGGYDSRIILAALKLLGKDNVTTFTYGRSGFSEFINSEKTAKILGYKWLKIDYDNIVEKDFLESTYFQNYYKYAANDSSMFYLQDYFAIRWLKEQEKINQNTLFVSGHSGDFLAGSHLLSPLNADFNTNKLTSIIKEKNCNWSFDAESITAQILEKLAENPVKKCWTAYENWELKERQAKFIVNSAKVYPFFGYNYILPLWDNRLIDFFENIPFEWKLHKKLYDFTLKKYFFEPLNISFEQELQATPRQKFVQNIKNQIKPLLPKRFVHQFTQNQDSYCYQEVINKMKNQIEPQTFKDPKQLNNLNAFLVQWYLIGFKNNL